MTISERILKVLKDRNMTQAEFAKQVGIATSTISEWKKRKTNPTADKIMDICNVLQITPEQLLTGKGIEDEENITVTSRESCFMPYDIQLVQDYHGLEKTTLLKQDIELSKLIYTICGRNFRPQI